jgi:ABC-2 type transport system ATP-binding protein
VFLELPPGAAVPELPGAVEATVSGRSAVVTTRDYSPAVHAACERAGAAVRDVQRLTLEEIFVATVMYTRQEAKR